ncbi:type IV pilus twitching motility protein PilT [Kineosporia sp. R_H_3]|uniref:type IV pilus twitching motility protein PilT n=1 Tax=Kineosporia sp. R_H_3 TaxID=1961848 RepID=UPI0018E99010|nr:type IV pilus twitching motility protein PilT [Kineosporia sp. R_H_3]
MSDANLPPGIDSLIATLWQARGTDLLLTAGARPLIRVDGDLHPVRETAVLTGLDTAQAVDLLLGEKQREQFAAGSEVDFSFSWRGTARIRGNAYRQRGDVAVALRIIPRQIPGFDDIRIPAAVRQFAALKQGLVLVTGPTGSGKSTTLASIINVINENRAVHILTIEDPIEYVHEHKRAAVSQREVGEDTESFAHALRSALREDPDVILVGEMRDLESIRFALTLAETGHLVLATLHTNDTAQAVDRLVDVFPADQQPQIRVQLASTLTGVVYQRLVPRLGGGMVAAHEVLVANGPVRNLIKEGKTNQLRNQLVTGMNVGMQTIEQSLGELVRTGFVTYEEATARSLFPGEIERPLVSPVAAQGMVPGLQGPQQVHTY